MKVVCVGGGPAGLYFALLMKLADAACEVTVLERNAADVTHGWGVVFWDDLLASLTDTDPQTARAIVAHAFPWRGQVVEVQGRSPVTAPGSGYGIDRRALIRILSERASSLGVQVEFGHQVDDLEELDADLVVLCDGVRSRFRQLRAAQFKPHVVAGGNKYVWLGTTKIFSTFTFAFVESSAGWLWCHAYGYSPEASTFIVECSSETWQGLGLDTLEREQSLALLERLFAKYLDGHPLLLNARDSDSVPWLSFLTVRNDSWQDGKFVLMGDAAHTTHFAIGAGTKLALQDAMQLAESLGRHRDLDAAVREYEVQRRNELLVPQREAHYSSKWLERVPDYIGLDAEDFAAVLHSRLSPVLAHVPPKVYLRMRRAADQHQALRGLYRRVRQGYLARRREA